VSLEGSRVITRIADNGKGFDVSKVTNNYSTGNSYGMINMSDRAEHIKGTLDLRSEPGKGTTITVAIPVELTSVTKTVKKDNRKAFARPQETALPRSGGGPMSPIS
jgi:signal transduction histidine kinase